MIQPRTNFELFLDDKDKLEKLQEWGLVSKRAKNLKPVFYKGMYTNEDIECDVIGYVEETLIIVLPAGEMHCINKAYLKDMQKKNFEAAI